MVQRESQVLVERKDHSDQKVKQVDRGTRDQQELVVFQAQGVKLDPKDLLVHKGHQEWWRKRVGLRWYQDPQDHQDHRDLRDLQEKMELLGQLELLVLQDLQEMMV